MKMRFLSLTGLMLAVMTANVQASVITVGQNDGGNCYPFSCLASDSGGTTYQQVYAASEFSGAGYINAISFFEEDGGLMDTADYEISFSTTSAPVLGLDTTWANNIGGDSALFGNYSLSGAMPAVLTFFGTSFFYDPSAGNLLMTVQLSNLTVSNGYESFFQADYTGIVTSRLWAYGNSATGSTGNGALRTEFDYSPSNAVPEPSSIAMLGLGALGLAFARRRRNTTIAS